MENNEMCHEKQVAKNLSFISIFHSFAVPGIKTEIVECQLFFNNFLKENFLYLLYLTVINRKCHKKLLFMVNKVDKTQDEVFHII